VKTFKLLWKIIKFRPMIYLVNCIGISIVNLIPILVGIVIKDIFDVLNSKAKLDSRIIILVLLLFILYISRICTYYLDVRIEIIQKFSTSALLRRNMLNGILLLPGAKSTFKSTGEVLNSFRDDVNQVEDYVGQTVEMVGTLFLASAAFIILLNINTKITIVVFTPLIIIVVAAKLAGTRIAKYRKSSRIATALVNSALGEMFSSVQAIQVANAEKYVLENFRVISKERQKSALKDDMFTQLLSSIFQNIVGIGTGLILLISAQSIKTGGFTVGDFAIFVYYLYLITLCIEFTGDFLTQYKQTGVSFQRMIKVLDDKSCNTLVKHNPLLLKGEIPKTQNIVKKHDCKLYNLEVRSLSYKYPNSKCGIENVNFKIKRNTFTVITGRIGSGKTTLVRVILGLLPYDSGEIFWNDKLVKDPENFFIPPYSAYTAQVPHLFSETLKNNILLGLDENKVDLKNSIVQAVLEQDIESLENGLDTEIGTRGTKLSGGQQQRVAAARMFVRDAELLVFDDISSALDIETELLLWDNQFKNNNKTFIVVSNRRAALKQADNIIVLKEGRVESQGTLVELLENCKEMQLIWGD